MLNNFAERDYTLRLDGTICRYQGYPVVVRVNDGVTFNLYRMEDTQHIWKNINPRDEAFDVASIPLGYCQSNENVVYLSRKPLRKMKQGVDDKSMSYNLLPDVVEKKGISYRDLIYSKNFTNMVIDKYPSLDSALDTLRKSEKPMSLAVSRDVALHVNKVKVVNVYYKNDLVGWLAPGDRTVHVPNDPMGWIVSKYLRGFNWIID